jgi:hypothetical protein
MALLSNETMPPCTDVADINGDSLYAYNNRRHRPTSSTHRDKFQSITIGAVQERLLRLPRHQHNNAKTGQLWCPRGRPIGCGQADLVVYYFHGLKLGTLGWRRLDPAQYRTHHRQHEGTAIPLSLKKSIFKKRNLILCTSTTESDAVLRCSAQSLVHHQQRHGS